MDLNSILQAGVAAMFPHLAGVEIDYCWGGLVGMTADRYPRAGEADGLIYGTGYSGHGAQLSTLIGQVLADLAMGRKDTNPLAGMDWNKVPLLCVDLTGYEPSTNLSPSP